jgi:hypothetical protein
MVIKVEKIQRSEEQLLARTARLLAKKQALEYLKESTENVDSSLSKVKKDFAEKIKNKIK